jgi:membrane protease YdiL (CAAX protease family)
MAPRDITSLLRYFGAEAWWFLPGLAVVMVLLGQHWVQRRRFRFELRGQVLAGMVVESLIEMLPLIVISHVTGRVIAGLAATAPPSRVQVIFQEVLVAIGAGIYEEFIFRLVFISVALLLLVDVFGLNQRVCSVTAVALGAALFSLYHFSATQMTWASFPWGPFVFRTLAGCYLGAIFVFRGFGVAVGAHIFWNLYTLLYRL